MYALTAHRYTDTQTYRHTGKQTHRHTDIQTHRHTDIQAHRQTDTQTHRHTDTHTDIQIHTHVCWHTEYIKVFLFHKFIIRSSLQSNIFHLPLFIVYTGQVPMHNSMIGTETESTKISSNSSVKYTCFFKHVPQIDISILEGWIKLHSLRDEESSIRYKIHVHGEEKYPYDCFQCSVIFKSFHAWNTTDYYIKYCKVCSSKLGWWLYM